MSSLFRRCLAIGALSLTGLGLSIAAPSDASASVSIAVGFDALVKDADLVAVISSSESKSVWEEGRIYTYTKVKVDQNVAGDVGAGSETWVRTMGGVVGKIGQLVDGEPVFAQGKPSLLFMRKFKGNDVFEVSARAQGQYPVVLDEKKAKRVMRSAHAGMLLPPKDGKNASSNAASASQVQTQTQSVGPYAQPVTAAQFRLAQEVIHDKPLDDVAREVATTWKKLHPAPTK